MKENRFKILKDDRTIFFIILFLFLYTYLPFLALGLFNHSNSDDFWISVHTYHALKNTGSVWEAIKAGWRNSVWIWKSWDGCFLSMFFMTLSPVAFHEDLYAFVYPFISISFMTGVFSLAYVILRKILKMDWWRTLSVYFLFLILVFQFTPYYGEAFYWWPGAVNYTFFFGVTLFTQAMVAWYLYNGNKKAIIIGTITAFSIGLGNLMTGLINPLIILLECIWFLLVLKKKDKKILWVTFVFALAGLMLNVCAPGNLIRGGSELFQGSIPMAIFKAITGATGFIFQYYNKIQLFYFLLFVLLVFEAMGHIKTDFDFRYPLLFFIFSYGVYCAIWAPVTYTGVMIYARLNNLLFLGEITMITLNVAYLSGWIHKKILKGARLKWTKVAVYAAFLLTFLWYGKFWYLYPSEQARVQVMSGNAKQFDEQMDERFDLYYDDTVKEVYVSPLEYVPGLFFIQDSSFGSLEEYFGKTFIKYKDGSVPDY